MSDGWDDPRMPTIAGDAPPGHIRPGDPRFREDAIGVAKRDNSVVDIAMFDAARA
jgi:hypothetical protein